MNFHVKIALHYLKPKNNSFISLLSFISIAGIAIGVMALIVVLSVMNGFDHSLEKRVIGIESHIVVLNYSGSIIHYRKQIKKILSIKGVKSASPFVYSDVMISSSGASTGSVLRGIDLSTAVKATSLKKYIVSGSLQGINSSKFNCIILGRVLARELGVSVGDNVSIISPQGEITPFGVMPKTEKFRVCGIIDTGMYNYDSTFSFISIKNAQFFLGMPGNMASGIEVKVNNINLANSYAKKIASALNKKSSSSFYALSWEQLNRALFSAIKLEKLTMFVILSLIVLVAAFNIISTLIMVVIEKRKDIAVLKTMGASSADIMKIFMIQGVIIGFAGALLGLVSGFLIAYLQKTYRIVSLPQSIYYIKSLPIRMTPDEFIIISLSALFLSFIATLYPSYKASRIDPAEGVRYE